MIARLVCALLLAFPSIAHAETLDSVFANIARSPGFYAHFHEEKKVALLVLPLKQDGTVHFDKVHGLARHTTSPRKESIMIAGGALTLWDGTKIERIPLQSSASLRALAEAFALTLGADRAGLEKSFVLGFRDLGATWQLTLSPRSADLKKLVTDIEVDGSGTTPQTLIVREASGDVSTTRFDAVDMNKRYTDSEAATLFKLPPGG